MEYLKSFIAGKYICVFNVYGSVHRKNILIYIYNKMQRYTVYFVWKLLYMFRVVPPTIIRSANNCIYSIHALTTTTNNAPTATLQR